MKYRKKLYIFSILIGFSAFLSALLFFRGHPVEGPKELIIFDVHPESPRIVKDDGSIEFADYVRIRNMTDHPYDLTGLFLSDSGKNLKKLPLDGIVLDVEGSEMIRLDPSWNFALSRTGSERIYLSDTKGNILFCYTSDMKPKSPVISADSGFYDEEFDVTISGKDTDPIYYTLDGSEPTMDSPVYSGPIHVYDRSAEPNSVVNVENTIKNYRDEYYTSDEDGLGYPVEKPIEEPVDKATILKAAAIDQYGNKSETVTRQYFFCKGKYKSIISVVADPEDLFGDYGILSVGKSYDEWYLGDREGEPPSVNYHNKGRDWEVPAEMIFFRNDQTKLTQACGLKLQGRTTRDRRIKNFQIRARRSYSGSDVFEYDFFDNERYRSDALILDDCFKESFFLSLIENENILKQRTTDRVALFVNGEFWNNIYIRSKLDERFFEDHYAVKPDNLLVMAESFPEIAEREDEEDWNTYRAMYLDIDEFVSDNDITDISNYEKVREMMDIDSYIDYLAINEWAGCSDWGEFNNDMYWRFIEPDGSMYGDGRFRWIIHDGDTVFTPDASIRNNPMMEESTLYNALMRNGAFRQQFNDRLKQLGNTIFSDANIQKELSDPKWDEPEKEEIREFFETRKNSIQELINDDNF